MNDTNDTNDTTANGDDARLEFAATQRNRGPILEVLMKMVPRLTSSSARLLELASGSGEHAMHFAQQLPRLTVLPSDPDPKHRASINAWAAHLGVDDRVERALDIDVTRRWPLAKIHAVTAAFCANMIHIAPWSACEGLFRNAQGLIISGPPLVLYGPFLRRDVVTAESNLAFDASLKARDPAWGIRHLDDVVAVARQHQLVFDHLVEMPANNLMVMFSRQPTEML